MWAFHFAVEKVSPVFDFMLAHYKRNFHCETREQAEHKTFHRRSMFWLRPSASPLYTEPCCASRDVITSNSHFHSAQFKGFSNLVASEAIKSNRRFISPSIECLEKSIFKQIPRRDKNLCLAISVEKLFLRIRKLKVSSWIILKWIHLSRTIFMRFLRKLMKKKTQVSSTTSRFLKISSQRT